MNVPLKIEMTSLVKHLHPTVFRNTKKHYYNENGLGYQEDCRPFLPAGGGGVTRNRIVSFVARPGKNWTFKIIQILMTTVPKS